jgi:hypothetical protein
MLGRYHFAVPEEVLRGELRPLRDLNDADEVGPQRGSGRRIPPLVSKIQIATTNAVARARGGLTSDFFDALLHARGFEKLVH